jgi:hypothetical protein
VRWIPIRHFVRRHAARDQPRSIVALHGFGFSRTFLRSESASDRFHDVGARNESLKLSVLVVNERHHIPIRRLVCVVAKVFFARMIKKFSRIQGNAC